MNKLINYECPDIGEEFEDIDGNKFLIEEIDLKNRLGREIRGTVTWVNPDRDSKKSQFSTTLQMWSEVWRDKCPRQDPRKMKC